jgi:hypothetical protein
MENGNLTTQSKPILNKKKLDKEVKEEYIHPELDIMTESEKTSMKINKQQD